MKKVEVRNLSLHWTTSLRLQNGQKWVTANMGSIQWRPDGSVKEERTFLAVNLVAEIYSLTYTHHSCIWQLLIKLIQTTSINQWMPFLFTHKQS